MNKQQLRKELLQLRMKQDNQTISPNNAIIINKTINYLTENNYKNILIYIEMKGEVAATKLINKGYHVFITKTMPDLSMKVTKYNSNKLILHQYGFYETTSIDYIDPQLIEVILIPGIAFDLQGNRLGYGKGYYDRFLAKYPSIKRIGLAFDLQLVDTLPTNEYDQSMDLILTESRELEFTRLYK